MIFEGIYNFEIFKVVKCLMNQLFFNFNSYLYFLFKEKENLEEKL